MTNSVRCIHFRQIVPPIYLWKIARTVASCHKRYHTQSIHKKPLKFVEYFFGKQNAPVKRSVATVHKFTTQKNTLLHLHI
jgi:hypothetical protein